MCAITQAWEGGAEGDGWVVRSLQVENASEATREGFPRGSWNEGPERAESIRRIDHHQTPIRG